MKTDQVLKEIRKLIKAQGWSARIVQPTHIRLKDRRDRGFVRNPIAALGLQLLGLTNLKWNTPGTALGLTDDEIEDLHLAADFRWPRAWLRRKLLEACGLDEPRFEEALRYLEGQYSKTRLEKVFRNLSVDDMEELDKATNRADKEALKRIVQKN